MKKILKQNYKKIFGMFLLSVLAFMLPMIHSMTTHAEDADHKGMVYLSTTLDASTHHVSSTVSGAEVGNSLGGQDVWKSPEWESEKILFGADSWDISKDVLAGKFANNVVDFVPSKYPYETFTNEKADKTFQKFASNSNWDNDGDDNPNTTNLVMSFPGWGAGDTVADLTKPTNQGKFFDGQADRTDDDKTPDNFVHIDQAQQNKAASSVNAKLVDSFNSACDLFYSHIDGNPNLSKAGIANLVWGVAGGYLPANKKANIQYDSNDGTFSGDIKQGDLEVVKDADSKHGAGQEIVKLKTPDDGAKSFNKSFTYAVTKGSTPQSAPGDGKYKGSDEYALTWYDLAIASMAHSMMDDTTDGTAQQSGGNTVVGDQVNQFLYGIVSGILGALGIRTVDELLFGTYGNLFNNGTYGIYMALMAPFLFCSLLVLGFVSIKAYLKSQIEYLSTDQVKSIQASVGTVFSAVTMIIAYPFGVLMLMYLDQQIIKVISDFATEIQQIVHQIDPQGVSLGILGIILAFIMIFLDIKYTFRYVARAISFGIYFMTAPLLFAIDALRNPDGGWFQYGQTTGEVWKNTIGLIFQRDADALGVVLAVSVGRLAFGDSPMISIIGMLTVPQIVTAIMDLFGVKGSTIQGVAETGENLFKRGRHMARKAAVAGGAAALTPALAAGVNNVRRGKNLDTKAFLAKKNQETNPALLAAQRNGATTTGGNLEGSFDDDKSLAIGSGGNGGSGIAGLTADPNAKVAEPDFKNGKPTINNGDASMLTERNGQIVSAKGSLKKNVGRFFAGMGGAGAGSGPDGKMGWKERFGSAGKTLGGAAFAATAAVTPGKLDDYFSDVLIGNNVQNKLSDRHIPVGETLGNTLAMKAIGMTRSAFNPNDYRGSGSSKQAHSPMRTQTGLGGSAQPAGVAAYSTVDPKTGPASYFGYDGNSLNDKVLGQANESANNLYKNLTSSGAIDDNQADGKLSREDVMKNLFYKDDKGNSTGQVNTDAKNVLDHMDQNGFSDVTAMPTKNQTAWTAPLQKSKRTLDMTDKGKGGVNEEILNNVAQNGSYTDPTSGSVYKRDPENKDKVQQYTPDVTGGSRVQSADEHNVVQQASEQIMKDHNMGAEEKTQKMSQLYTTPNNLDAAHQVLSQKNNRNPRPPKDNPKPKETPAPEADDKPVPAVPTDNPKPKETPAPKADNKPVPVVPTDNDIKKTLNKYQTTNHPIIDTNHNDDSIVEHHNPSDNGDFD